MSPHYNSALNKESITIYVTSLLLYASGILVEMNSNPWFRTIRFYVLVVTLTVSLFVFLGLRYIVPTESSVFVVRLQQLYAFLGILYLYVTLLAGPLCYTFPKLPFRGQYISARRALGVSAFYFTSLHVGLSFFGQLGGFGGIGFLTEKYVQVLGIGLAAFVILFLLALTSFDFVIAKMTFVRWKFLHRLVYVAGILTLIHVVMLGSHFSNLSSAIPTIFFIALTFLLLLEAPRVDAVIRKYIHIPDVGITSTAVLVLCGVLFFTIIRPLFPTSGGAISFDIHAEHKRLALEAKNGTQGSSTNQPTTIAGLQGDRTKRYSVSFFSPETVKPNQDTKLRFTVTDASNGRNISLFRMLYTKPMHLVVVDSSLEYFSHIHPTHTDDGFEITTQFPKEGIYHLYSNFQPLEGIEQQFAFTIQVGEPNTEATRSTSTPDIGQRKTFGDYGVELETEEQLRAESMTLGEQKLRFTITSATNSEGIQTLKPYLGAFGHVTMVNVETFDYIHVHPFDLTVLSPDSVGGPVVEFLPIGIHGPFKAGRYRVFAEFNPDNNVFVSDFTVDIE